MARSNRNQEDKHEHNFGFYNRCTCGVYRLTHNEYHDRLAVWDKHYEACKKTDSATSYYLCREAFAKGDIAAVKDFTRQAIERREKGVYLPKPTFLEPRKSKDLTDENWVYCV